MIRNALAVLAFLVTISGPARACSCAKLGPRPCEGLSSADVIFVGTVLEIENPAPDETRGADQGGNSRYHFQIDENIAGTGGKEIDVYSSRGGADCSYHFRQGVKYLLFVYRASDGRLLASTCSPTREIEYADAVVPQLRAMRDHQRVASLYGVLRTTEEPYSSVSDESFDRPLAHTNVELRSVDHVFQAKTDADGVYSFYYVPSGSYRIEADLPANFELAEEILDSPLPPLELPAGACYEYDVNALPTGSIRGSVAGPDGKPLPFASVELFRTEKYTATFAGMGWSEAQGEDGVIEFQHVAPGDYILVYNNSDKLTTYQPFHRAFYPGVTDRAQAKQIHLEPGQHFLDANIQVSGGRTTRQVTVRLIALQGTLPGLAFVETRGVDGSNLPGEAIEPGVYKIKVFRGVRYSLHGEGYCSATSRSVKTEAVEIDGSDDTTAEITLMFAGEPCDD
jgi:hypothetical protein